MQWLIHCCVCCIGVVALPLLVLQGRGRRLAGYRIGGDGARVRSGNPTAGVRPTHLLATQLPSCEENSVQAAPG